MAISTVQNTDMDMLLKRVREKTKKDRTAFKY